MCLDDLQWACPATLAAVWTLPNELKNHPVAWVFARSWAPTGNSEYLFDLLEDGGATRITLDPLSREAVAGLLTDAFSAPPDEGLRLLAAGAAGNPWLLSELIDGLRDEFANDHDGRRSPASSVPGDAGLGGWRPCSVLCKPRRTRPRPRG